MNRTTQIRIGLIAARNGLMACAVCAVLAACAGQETGRTVPATAEAEHADRSMGSPPGDSAPATAATPAVPPPPQLAAIDPAKLVGMTGTRISSLFGTPVFVRRDPPGEFWRYRGESCVLELFFYLRDGALRVDHIETRAGSGAPPDRADCVASLRKRPPKS